jgi:hypothetical protein
MYLNPPSLKLGRDYLHLLKADEDKKNAPGKPEA